MFLNLGRGRCPMCGDGADMVEKETFECRKCSVMFDDFMISFSQEHEDMEMYHYWN